MTHLHGFLASALALFVLGCADGAGDATDAGPDAGDGVVPLAERRFQAFAPWATPIADYQAVGEVEQPFFDPGINELMPAGQRLWIGYGDGTYNLGEILPIEFRYFAGPDDPAAAAATVDGAGQGAEQTSPTQSGEEVIANYRVAGGALWQAGLDSIDADELWTQAQGEPKAIAGNVYRLEGEIWRKFRSLVGGEHVQDVTFWDGAHYAVGSGADWRSEFEAGEIFRYLWRSDDEGASFTTVTRIQHPTPGAGDTRWVWLLPLAGGLHLFGYESDFATGSASISNARTTDGESVTVLAAGEELADIWADGTLGLPDGSGLLWGTQVAGGALVNEIWHVSADGLPTRLEAFAGRSVLDVQLVDETDEILFLARDGDAYGEELYSVASRVFVAPATSPQDVEEVDVPPRASTDAPRALAYWLGALYLGTEHGEVLRAASR